MTIIPICKDCGQPMIEICGTGKIIKFWTEGLLNSFGIRERKLYQCPECKNIAAD